MSDARAISMDRRKFMLVHMPELLTAEGKSNYAYFDFPRRQSELLSYWKRCVEKIFFFFAHSALVPYPALFEALSVDGFEPVALPFAVAELTARGEFGVLPSGDLGALLSWCSLPDARRKQLELEELPGQNSCIVCYELLEARLRATEVELDRLLATRPFLTESEFAEAMRKAGVTAGEEAAVRVLLLAATSFAQYQTHYFRANENDDEDRVGRRFLLFTLEQAAHAPATTPVEERERVYDRVLLEFATTNEDLGAIIDFRNSLDYVRLKAVAPPKSI